MLRALPSGSVSLARSLACPAVVETEDPALSATASLKASGESLTPPTSILDVIPVELAEPSLMVQVTVRKPRTGLASSVLV